MIIGGDMKQSYTHFGGTSAATPIVASCIIVLQSYYYSLTGKYMTSYEMRDLLVSTGTPQTGTKHIGPLPNMKNAIQEIDRMLNVTEIEINDGYILFPNPANDKVTIRSQSLSSSDTKIELLNINGSLISSHFFADNETYISLEGLSSGTYLIRISGGNNSVTKKIIKI
jgi:hypothetical protein